MVLDLDETLISSSQKLVNVDKVIKIKHGRESQLVWNYTNDCNYFIF